jgi:transposase
MAGVDMSDAMLALEIAHNERSLGRRSFGNDPESWEAMVRHLKACAQKAGAATVVVAYEAGPHGMGLHDFLSERGMVCHMFAPTRMKHSPKSRKHKTDAKDAEGLLEVLRGHLLAGNKLPGVWIPDARLRDDREIVRGRLDAGAKTRQTRTQIQSLLKRHTVRKPQGAGQGWSQKHRAWLRGLCQGVSPLGSGARTHLSSLLRELDAAEQEEVFLEEAVARLSQDQRYARMFEALDAQTGVGLLTAMVFLTELGDPQRFANRRQVAAYFGLVPSSNETGKRDDCKGPITHQGSPRVRWVLCQAYHAEVRTDPAEKARYQRLVQRNPKRKKVAIVAGMRRKAIRLWHAALNVQRASTIGTPPSRPPQGGKRQFALPASPRQHARRPPVDEERRRAV